MILESGDDNKNYNDFEGMLYSLLCQIKWGFNAKNWKWEKWDLRIFCAYMYKYVRKFIRKRSFFGTGIACVCIICWYKHKTD